MNLFTRPIDHNVSPDDDAPTMHDPLAIRMRPTNLDEIVGQRQALTPGSPLRRMAMPVDESMVTAPSSIILYGPPGVGKTTIAHVIAKQSHRKFIELSATSASVKDVKESIANAKKTYQSTGLETILFIDEIHRFSKNQQDALLPGVENRDVTFIAATTENPSYAVIRPLISRSVIVRLEALTDDDLRLIIDTALHDPRGLHDTVTIDKTSIDMIIRSSGGDGRKVLVMLEAASNSALAHDKVITADIVNDILSSAGVNYDRGGDQHYDYASAFIKSMRGSNPDAALHYAAMMLRGGEDPRFIARRVIIAAAEEVGLAAPEVLTICTSAAQAVDMIGMPEARIPLSEAIIAVATAPKSNASYLAMNQALDDVDNRIGEGVPLHLRNATNAQKRKDGYGAGYQYAHDYPHAVSPQEYMPEGLEGVEYYHPTNRGHELEINERMQKVRSILRSA